MTIDVHKIDKDVPIPPQRKSTLKHYPLDALEVGDSLQIPLAERSRIQVAASYVKKRTGKEFTGRTEDDKFYRIWRTK